MNWSRQSPDNGDVEQSVPEPEARPSRPTRSDIHALLSLTWYPRVLNRGLLRLSDFDCISHISET